jgi:hypothetical protein
MFSISFKNLALASLTVAVFACGGGKSGGDKGPVSGGVSSSSISSFTVDAGVDKTVNAGDKIELKTNLLVVGGQSFTVGSGNLETKGASANPKDIVLISWTKVEGPAVALSTNGTTTANVSFQAPSAGKADFYTIIYKLTAVTADGTKAEDSVTFTVNRVNQAPVVNAGIDQHVDGLAAVSFTAVASDPDGTIASYQWVQKAGASVVLTGATSVTLQFAAPSTTAETTLEFEVTVTDNNGLTAKDTFAVVIKPENSPLVQFYFPSRVGIYKDTVISASGIAIPKSGTISGVTVDLGAGPMPTTVNPDGTWRINSLSVPVGVSEFTIQVVATDSVGRTGNAKATLKTSGDSVGNKIDTTANWSKTIGVAVDNSKNIAYVLATGSLLKDLRLFPIDLATGDQGADISNFSDTTKGINSSAVVAMTYDAEQHVVYVSTSPSGTILKPQIMSISTTTGQRSLVSDNTRGTGANWANPRGLTMGANHTLYVADNVSNTIVAVDTVSGNRTVVASKDTLINGISVPLLLASDTSSSHNRLFMIANATTNYVLGLNLAVAPATSALVTDSSLSTQGSVTLHSDPQGIVHDLKMNALFVDDGSTSSQIVKVDTITGNRTKLLVTEWLNSYIDYDTKNQLLYLVDGLSPGLFVVDPFTGKKVLISK